MNCTLSMASVESQSDLIGWRTVMLFQIWLIAIRCELLRTIIISWFHNFAFTKVVPLFLIWRQYSKYWIEMNWSILGALKDQIDDSAQGHTFIRACQVIPSRVTFRIVTEIIPGKVARFDFLSNLGTSFWGYFCNMTRVKPGFVLSKVTCDLILS